jgi:hypothetical protein
MEEDGWIEGGGAGTAMEGVVIREGGYEEEAEDEEEEEEEEGPEVWEDSEIIVVLIVDFGSEAEAETADVGLVNGTFGGRNRELPLLLLTALLWVGVDMLLLFAIGDGKDADCTGGVDLGNSGRGNKDRTYDSH